MSLSRFRNLVTILFQDGHYYVHLPWNGDLVKQVPSNLKVSLAIAERVYKNLEKQNIATAYEDVLMFKNL